MSQAFEYDIARFSHIYLIVGIYKAPTGQRLVLACDLIVACHLVFTTDKLRSSITIAQFLLYWFCVYVAGDWITATFCLSRRLAVLVRSFVTWCMVGPRVMCTLCWEEDSLLSTATLRISKLFQKAPNTWAMTKQSLRLHQLKIYAGLSLISYISVTFIYICNVL